MKHSLAVYFLVVCVAAWSPLATLLATDNLAGFLGGGVSTPAPSYLLEENFEAPGYENSWTTGSGTPDPDYTTTVLQGSYSFTNGATSTNVYSEFSAQSTVYAYCLLKRRTQGTVTNSNLFTLRDGSTVKAGLLQNYSATNTQFKLSANGSVGSASSVSQSSGDTTTVWHVWITYVASGSCQVAMSTDGLKPSSDGSGAVFLTATGAAGTANRIYLNPSSSDGAWIFDRVIVSTSPIGNNP